MIFQYGWEPVLIWNTLHRTIPFINRENWRGYNKQKIICTYERSLRGWQPPFVRLYIHLCIYWFNICANSAIFLLHIWHWNMSHSPRKKRPIYPYKKVTGCLLVSLFVAKDLGNRWTDMDHLYSWASWVVQKRFIIVLERVSIL